MTTVDDVNALVSVMRDATAPADVRVLAATTILDLGYGLPAQVMAGDEDGAPSGPALGPLSMNFSRL